MAVFDGHGRMTASHRPEQRDSNDDPAFTTYNHNADGSISQVTDARGAVTHHTYNSRGLLTERSWTVPHESGIEVPATVEFEYDNAGNRIEMEDGLGTVEYEYNELSQMTAETRSFDDTLANAPLPNNTYKLEYVHALGGQLKSYTDPGGRVIEYEFDKMGRVGEVKGTLSSINTTYANNPHYRAWGALESLDYGNGTEMTSGGFNNRLQATSFQVGDTDNASRAISEALISNGCTN